jgi:diguanylate cyclase (GGDEF)-like protein
LRLPPDLPKLLIPIVVTLLGTVVLTIGLSFGALEQRKTQLAVSAQDMVSINATLSPLLHFRNQSAIREALLLKLRLETKPQKIWLRVLHVDGEILAKAPRRDSDRGTTQFIRTFRNRLEVLTAVDLFAHNSEAYYRGALAAIPFMDAQFKMSTPVFSLIDPLRTDVPRSAYQQTLLQKADQPLPFVAGYIEQGIFLGDILETIIPTLWQALIMSMIISATMLLAFYYFAVRSRVSISQRTAQTERSDQKNLPQKMESARSVPTNEETTSAPEDRLTEPPLDETRSNIGDPATLDPVTSLPDRHQLLEHMAQGMRVAAAEHRCMGLVLIEVCSIRDILRTRGREVSDNVLREMTSRILNSIRRSDFASRGYDALGEAILDADQFCIVLCDLDNIQGVGSAAERLLGQLRLPVTVADEALSLNVVASAATAPQHSKTPEGLIIAAKSALIQARESRAPNTILFSS